MANIPVTLAIKTLLDADNLAQSKAALNALGASVWNFVGAYSGGTAYAVGDVVTYQGQTWYRLNANGGNVGDTPSEGAFWTILAQAGAGGGGAGTTYTGTTPINVTGTTISLTPLTGDVTTSSAVATIAAGAVTAAKLAPSAVNLNTATIIGTLPINRGGTGVSVTPSLVSGTAQNIAISGTWPSQTITSLQKQELSIYNALTSNGTQTRILLATFPIPQVDMVLEKKIHIDLDLGFTFDVAGENSWLIQITTNSTAVVDDGVLMAFGDTTRQFASIISQVRLETSGSGLSLGTESSAGIVINSSDTAVRSTPLTGKTFDNGIDFVPGSPVPETASVANTIKIYLVDYAAANGSTAIVSGNIRYKVG